jgi:hypothetical protein
VASTENESDTHQTPPMSGTRRSESSTQSELSMPSSARRKLRLMDTESGGLEEKKGDIDSARIKLPQAIVVEDEDFVSMEREGVSDFAESEVEGVARRYLMQTLNRTLVELFHACDADGNIDRCDHALSILQEATRSFQVLRDRMAQGTCLSSETGADSEVLSAVELGSVRKLHKHLENDEDSMDAPGMATENDAVGRSDIIGDSDYYAADSSQRKPQIVQTWCDIVRRQDSLYPANSKESILDQRSLHEKLLSPDRHRKNPEAVQRKQEEKQELAKRKREEIETQRQEKLREAELLRQEKLRQIKEKRETEKISMDERLKRAHDLYQSRLLERQLKAGKETTKVHEVKQEIAFIDLLTAENKTMALQTRLELAEGRRLHMLEVAAKVSERTAREVSARQRRAAIEGAKIERLQARQAQKFGAAGDILVTDSADTVDTLRQLSIRDDVRDRTTVAREEAARLRRAQLEEERQRKVEIAAQEKEQRAEEHQRKLLEERMKVLAAKEARLRHQAHHLERMTQAMQADALAQRESLEQRLQCVLDRKQRYMAQIVAKAQGDKVSSMHSEGSMEQSFSLPDKESIEEIEEKTSKGQRKRAKKFKQRLAGIRNAWQEKEEDSLSGARASAAGSRLPKLSRLFSEVIKGAPAGEDLEKMSNGNKGNCPLRQPCRDLDSMVRTMQEIHRSVKQEEGEFRLGPGASSEERELIYSSIRKSGCIAALIRLVSADEKLAYQRLLSGVLKVLIDVCTSHETNRLYIVSTGRLIPLIDSLETAISSISSACFPDSEGCNMLIQLMVIVSICFRSAAETTIQAQARDDTLGYLVNCGILLKMERLIISVIRLVAGSSAPKSVDQCEAKNQRCTAHLKILEAAVTLLEAITMCYETNGQIKSAVRDGGVLTNLVAALDEGQLVGLVPLLSTLVLDAKMCTSPSVNADLLKEKGALPNPVKTAPGVYCAVKTLRALNNIAVLDLPLVQRTLGSVVVCSEFSHVALEILELCKSNPALHSELAMHGSSLALPSELLHELILLLGYLAFSSSPGVQSPFAGWRNGVKMLQQLCALPISYFISPPLREVLLPTLVVATFKNPALLDAMRDQVSARLLATYLDHYYKCMHNRGLDPSGLPNEGISKQWARLPPSLVPCRFHLENRFPRGKWVEAAEWFRSWKYEDDTRVSLDHTEAT